MPIKTLQKRLTQVGVIRLGQTLTSKNNKPYPAKLETFRFTSPSRPLIDAVAALYGGEVKSWQNTTGPEWEVISRVKEIPVLVPPQKIDPSYEHWGNGYRDRLCDAETEQLRSCPCVCVAKWGDKFFDNAPLGQACKPTTRLSLMLADVGSLGVFKLESHGWNAASELPTLAEAIANATQPIPARLEIQPRQKKDFDPNAAKDDQIKSKSFMVPVLHFDFVTPAQAFGGQLTDAARQALGASNAERKALGSASVETEPEREPRAPRTAAEYKTIADNAQDLATVQAAWREAKEDGVLNEDLAAYLRKAGDKFAPKDTTPVTETPAKTPAEVPVEADADEPNADQVWLAIVSAAGERGWSTGQLEEKVAATMNRSSDECNGWQLAEFLEALKNGQVA